jgi:PhnB protein
MQINPYLAFNGKCKEAFTFYEKCLGGKIEQMMTNGQSPMAAQMPPDQHERIMHARLVVGDQVLMGGDAPQQYFTQPQGFSVALNFKERAEAERIFNAMSEGGAVKMPFQKTFWSAGFGMFVDRFGIPWMVNCEQEP